MAPPKKQKQEADKKANDLKLKQEADAKLVEEAKAKADEAAATEQEASAEKAEGAKDTEAEGPKLPKGKAAVNAALEEIRVILDSLKTGNEGERLAAIAKRPSHPEIADRELKAIEAHRQKYALYVQVIEDLKS